MQVMLRICELTYTTQRLYCLTVGYYRWRAAQKTFLESVPVTVEQQKLDAAAAEAAQPHQLIPAAAGGYDTAGYVHWSITQYQQQQREQEAAAAAAAVEKQKEGSKKRSAAAAGGGILGGPALKKLAAELAAGMGGQQWWYVPGHGDEQVRSAAVTCYLCLSLAPALLLYHVFCHDLSSCRAYICDGRRFILLHDPGPLCC